MVVTVYDFISSIGVNTHMAYTDGAYANVGNVAADLAFIGVTKIRDGVPNPAGGIPAANQVSALNVLAAEGIKFDLIVSPNLSIAQTIQQVVSFDQANPGAVIAVEGPNEINNSPVTYNGLNGQAAANAFQAALYQAVKAATATVNIAVYDYTGGIAAPWTVAGTTTRNADGSYTLVNGQLGFPVTIPTGISTVTLTFSGAGTGDSGLFPYPGHGQVTPITYSNNGIITYTYNNTSSSPQALYVDFADWGSTLTLTNVTVIGPGSTENLVTFDPNLSLAGLADYANAHPYAYGNNPIGPVIGGNYETAFGSTTPGPRVITETGYTTDANVPNGVSEIVQAQQIINGLLDAYKSGVSTTYLYELLDEKSDPSNTNAEMHYGLFNFDNTPKPAAIALHNFTTILSDTGANASSFQPGPLNYGLSDDANSTQSLLLAKSDGVFDIALWNDAAAGTTNVDPVTIGFGEMYQNVTVYDVITDTETQYTNVSGLSLGVGADPLIIAVDPNQSALLQNNTVTVAANLLDQVANMAFVSPANGASTSGTEPDIFTSFLAAPFNSSDIIPAQQTIGSAAVIGVVGNSMFHQSPTLSPLGLVAAAIAKIQF